MKKYNFDKVYKMLWEDMTSGSVLGGGAPSATPGQSGDTYAPGDARLPSILGVKKQKKKTKKESVPVMRRTFPKGM